MAAAYDPRMDAAYDPRMDAAYEPGYYGSGYDQRTLPGKAWSIFSIFRDNGIAGYICAAIVVFCLYLLLCYLLTKTGHQWWICGLYDNVMKFFTAETYMHKMSQQQANDVMVDIVTSNTKVSNTIEAAAIEIASGITDPTQKQNAIAEATKAALDNIKSYMRPNKSNASIAPKILSFASNPSEDTTKALKTFINSGAEGITLTTIFPTPNTDDAEVKSAWPSGIKQSALDAVKAAMTPDKDTLIKHYQMYDGPTYMLGGTIASELGQGRAIPRTMFMCVLFWAFLLFIGASKMALMTPVAIALATGISPYMGRLLNMGDGASGGTIMIVLAIMQGLVRVVEGASSGKDAHTVIRDATLSTTERLRSEFTRQEREQLMRNHILSGYKNAPFSVVASEAYRQLSNYR
jgi:hypothetical protein